MGEVTYREATAADCDGIVEFMHEIQRETDAQKQDTFSKTQWQWQYATWPRGSSVPLAIDDGRIVGYNHSCLFDVRYKGRRVLGAQMQDGATSPAYRGQGLFRELNLRHIDWLVGHGAAVGWGFPNHRSIYAYVRYGRNTIICRVPLYMLPLEPGVVAGSRFGAAGRLAGTLAGPLYKALWVPTARLAPGEEVVRLSGDEPELDLITEDFASRVVIALERTREFLKWRFLRKPTAEYTLWGLRRAGELVAYFVSREAPLFGTRTTLMMDLGCRNGADDALRRLIRMRAEQQRSEGIALVVMMGLHPFLPSLRQIGFVRLPDAVNPRTMDFQVTAYTREVDDDVYDPASWFVTLTEWDVF